MKRFLLVATLTLFQVACGFQPPEKPAVPDALLRPAVDQGTQWYQIGRAHV